MGSVYKITDNEKVYYGSTMKSLKIRFCEHRSSGNSCVTKYFNKDNMNIELVESVEDEEQLIMREKYYIQNNECCNYKKNLHRTKEEKVAQQKELHAKLWIKNKEKILLKRKIPYECPCGMTIQIRNKSKHEKSKYHIETCPII